MFYARACAMQDTTVTTPGFAYRVHGVVYGRPSFHESFFANIFPIMTVRLRCSCLSTVRVYYIAIRLWFSFDIQLRLKINMFIFSWNREAS